MENNQVIDMPVAEAPKDKPYVFRRLQAKDIFVMCKIIKSVGVNEFMACFEGDALKSLMNAADVLTNKKNNGEEVDADEMFSLVGVQVGLEIVDVLVGNLQKCEKDIYRLLANVSGMKPEQIESLDFVVFTEMVIDFIKKDEFKDFIKVVSKYL